MTKANGAAPRFRVGDWVRFQYGARKARAQVIEDRGRLGIARRRLYRIRLAEDPTAADAFEMPEDELEAAGPVGKDRD